MEIEKLIEAAKADDNSAFGALLQTHVQEAVAVATEPLVAGKKSAEDSVGKLETNRDKLLGELKPFQTFLKDRELDGLDALSSALEGETKLKVDPEEIRDLKKRLAMASTNFDTAQTELTEARTASKQATELAAERLAERDDIEFRRLVDLATIGNYGDGTAKPSILKNLRPYAHSHFRQFFSFEEVPDKFGELVRSPVAKHGDMPIMGADGPASVSDVVRMGAAGGDKPWQKGARDFFVSNGSGGDAHNLAGRKGVAASPDQLAALASTKSIAAYAKQRNAA